MRVPHSFYIRNQRFFQLSVRKKRTVLAALPRKKIHFVDIDRRRINIRTGKLFEIFLILPDKAVERINFRSVRRIPAGRFRMKRIRIRLVKQPSVLRFDAIFISRVAGNPLYENFKRLSVYQAGHYMCRGIPAIEFAYERYAFRPRRPHAEHKSFLSAASGFVRPEKFVSFIIYAVMK